jgi:hypothetical protein
MANEIINNRRKRRKMKIMKIMSMKIISIKRNEINDNVYVASNENNEASSVKWRSGNQ